MYKAVIKLEVLAIIATVASTVFCFIGFSKLYEFAQKQDNKLMEERKKKIPYNQWQKLQPKEEVVSVNRFPNCLTVLGFSDWPKDSKEIKDRFHKLAREKHPDMGGSSQEFENINQAYNEAMLLDRYKK